MEEPSSVNAFSWVEFKPNRLVTALAFRNGAEVGFSLQQESQSLDNDRKESSSIWPSAASQ